ncbi:MAG: DUF4214 domain-containing protein [Clostridiales bacterium]|nr:DUF4214 domain-containing protein [Clostridiales bacterium]
MTKSRRLLSFAVAVFMVFSMFSFVYADPSGWDAAGYLYPGTMGPNSTGFNWRYKESELQIDFAPAAYSGTTSSVNDFYICFNKAQAGNACKVVCSYLGNENFPSLKFYGNNDKEYNFVFDSTMFHVVTLDYVNLKSISVNTTKSLYLYLDEFNSSQMPSIETNKSKHLSVTATGCMKKEVNVGQYYNAKNVDFEICDSSILQKVTIDSSITTIPVDAFRNNSALKSVVIPNSVTSIEYGAFCKDTSLQEINIPKSVKTIRPDAFEDSGLKDIYYDGTKEDWNEINIYETYLDENDIPWITFDGLLSKQAITVHCSDGNITLPARVYNNVHYDGTKGYCAQTGGMPGFTWRVTGALIYVDVGYRDDTYPYSSVDDFLTKLDSASYLEINNNDNYSGVLKFAPKSESGKTIDNNMLSVFVGKAPIAYVTLDFLTRVPDMIGTGSSYITTINMKNVNCDTLPEVTINDASFLYLEFGKCTGETIELTDAYDDISINFTNKDKIEKAVFDEGIKTIASPCLKDSKNLKEVTLPSTVETIEYLSFSNCDSLQKISIPKSVKTIYDTAFSGNAKFTDIYYDGTKAEWEKIEIEKSTTLTPKLEFERGVVIHCKDGDINTKEPFKIVFESNGGSSVATQNIVDGSKATKPSDPTKAGYTFGGWYTDTTCTKAYDFNSEVTADITLYAKWTVVSTPAPSTPGPSTPGPATPAPSTTGGGFEDFVERLYTVALNRASEPEGKAFWCEHVGNGDLDGAQCAKEFLLSKEFNDRKLSDEDFLKVLYKTFFDRDAEKDPDGFNFWMNSLKTQGRDVVVDCFINSEEWCNVCASYGVRSGATRAKATIASANATAFATRLYTECLGRDPETEGLKFWSLGLTNLELTGKQAAHEFFFSKEFNDHDFDNKELINRMYKTFMGRDPEDEGMNFWLNEMKNGMTKEQVFDNFVNSAEFTQICKDYAIDRG